MITTKGLRVEERGLCPLEGGGAKRSSSAAILEHSAPPSLMCSLNVNIIKRSALKVKRSLSVALLCRYGS